jgi:hypothetical protein
MIDQGQHKREGGTFTFFAIHVQFTGVEFHIPSLLEAKTLKVYFPGSRFV